MVPGWARHGSEKQGEATRSYQEPNIQTTIRYVKHLGHIIILARVPLTPYRETVIHTFVTPLIPILYQTQFLHDHNPRSSPLTSLLICARLSLPIYIICIIVEAIVTTLHIQTPVWPLATLRYLFYNGLPRTTLFYYLL